MTAEELIARAAACQDCGKEHKYRQVGPHQWSWAAEGHSYRPVLQVEVVAMLRSLAAGSTP